MANLTPAAIWGDVPQIETTTPLLGGPGGALNLPAQALLNRFAALGSLDDASLGAALIGFMPAGTGAVGRSALDKLRDTVNAKDFGVVADGTTNDSVALGKFWTAITTLGLTGVLPAGTINAGTWRPSFTGGTKGFGMVGAGSGRTIIKFADIPPVTQNVAEPDLLKLIGTVGAPIFDVTLRGFTMDYSAQTNKGGAALGTLSQTDIKPFSIGMSAVRFDYCVGLRIDDVDVNELYGNGFTGRYSPFTLATDCRFTNVSAGNPGLTDSSGGGISFMLGCFGSTARNCYAFNTRTYQTTTTGGYVNVSAQGTPCGYIGFFSEFAMNENNVLPPYAAAWLNGNKATDTTNHANDENFGVVFENCLAYGYTIGFKAEGATPTTFQACVGLNCWIPFMGSGTRGRGVGCYADALNLDGLTCPQSGFNYVKALYTHYSNNNTENRYAGFTYDGCISHTKRYLVFTDNIGYGRFLNQQTWIDADSTLPALFQSRASAPVYGVEVRGGHVQVEGGAAGAFVDLYDMPALVLDLSVSNNSAFHYTFRLNGTSNGNCNGAKVSIRAKGLVGVHAINNKAQDFDLDFVLTAIDTTKSFAAGQSIVNSNCDYAKLKVQVYGHTALTSGNQNTGGWYCQATGLRPTIDFHADVIDGGSNAKTGGYLGIGGTDTRISRAIKTGDGVYNNPVVGLLTSHAGFHIDAGYCSDSGALVFNSNAAVGPVTFGSGIRASKLFSTALTAGSDPNAINNLYGGISLPEGMAARYLKPSLSGKEGWQVHAAGLCAKPWAATTAYSVGNFVRASGQVYRCTTAGTSGSTAPSVTSGTQSDGTAVWTWQGPFAQIVECGAYAAAALT